MNSRTPLSLTIGPLTFETPILLAPMAGYSDLAFRQSIRPLGGLGIAYTEMLNPISMLQGKGRRRETLLATDEADRPLGYQIYGTDVARLCAAARWLEAGGAQLVDINMGCPQRKIATRGAGSGLLRNPEEAIALAAQVVQAVKIPVTVKLRLGWDQGQLVAPEIARGVEQAGVAAVTVHGRTRGQGYLGQADLAAIRQVVEAVVHIPVIGNGDVTSPAAARRMLDETGCAALMIGRGVLANPWLIRDIWNDLRGEPPVATDRQARLVFMREHFQRMLDLYGPRAGTLLYRKWIPQYVRKLIADRREMVRWLQMTDPEEIKKAMDALPLDD